jgi:predicted TIM-barrel fold metal-dependent hydrolase
MIYMIIDFHTHCFPDKIAASAIETLVNKANIKSYLNGTASDLKDSMREAGIDISIVHNIVVKPHQTEKTNGFAQELLDEYNNSLDADKGKIDFVPRLLPFASIHPDDDGWKAELNRIKAAGFKGVKLHPDYQGFFINDYKMEPIYKEIARLGLIVLFHAGLDLGFPDVIHASAERIADVLPLLEKCTTVLAHMGGQDLHQDVINLLCDRNVYFDTSFAMDRMGDVVAKKIIRKHGWERILFATDSPWCSQKYYVNYLKTNICKDFLTEKQTQGILGGNARLLVES